MKCEQIHETVIRDLVDVITDVKDSEVIAGFRNRDKSFKSIANASSSLIMVFPMIIPKSIPIQYATMVAKAQERKCVSMLQILFSALSITNSKDGADFLSNFHKNIKFDNDPTVDDFIDALDKYAIEHESSTLNQPELLKAFREDMRNLSFYLPESVSESGLNNFKVSASLYGKPRVVQEISKNNKEEIDASNKAIGAIKGTVDIFKSQVLDSDVKKANELIPTSMVVNFVSTAYGDEKPISASMVVGVKVKLYLADSMDILNRITLKTDDRNALLKFIKATTREISFCRDFLFAIDKAKLDALSQSKKGSSSKFWKVLERRAIKSKARRSLGHINDATAITTLVITQEEVEYLKKTENIDLDKESAVRPIMDAYNLMSFIIVDESMETVKFLYDTGNDLFETLSFMNLEKESAGGETKKIINLMSKMQR